MASTAQSVSKSGSPPPKRRIRNFLLDPRFQLKYTMMVVAVTVVVAAVLGYFAYDYSVGQSESLNIVMLNQIDIMHPEAMERIEADAAAADRQVLMAIVGGILLMALALGTTGIIVTHKLVGPAYKLRRLLRDVADGHLKVAGRLRKGDELQEVFLAFEGMVEALRTRQEEEISTLEAAIGKAREAGASDDVLGEFIALRDRLQASLD